MFTQYTIQDLKYSEALNACFYNSKTSYVMGLACSHWFRIIACLQARQKLYNKACLLAVKTNRMRCN